MEAVHEITHYYSTHCTRRTKHCHGPCSPAFSEHTLPRPSPSPHHVLAECQHRCEHQQEGADDGHEEATGEGGGCRNLGWVKIPFLVQSSLEVVNLARGGRGIRDGERARYSTQSVANKQFMQTASNPPCHPILPNPLVQLPVHIAHYIEAPAAKPSLCPLNLSICPGYWVQGMKWSIAATHHFSLSRLMRDGG